MCSLNCSLILLYLTLGFERILNFYEILTHVRKIIMVGLEYLITYTLIIAFSRENELIIILRQWKWCSFLCVVMPRSTSHYSCFLLTSWITCQGINDGTLVNPIQFRVFFSKVCKHHFLALLILRAISLNLMR